jgi:hypothetical protein
MMVTVFVTRKAWHPLSGFFFGKRIIMISDG